jgi:ferredoxin-NADP reductase
MDYKAKIMSIEQEAGDLKRFIIVKPRDLKLVSGQSIMVSANKPGFEELRRKFTFISLDNDYYLEFLFKEFPAHDRFSENLRKVKAGEELILSDAIGELTFKGKGVFISSGMGVLPFISIFRRLRWEDNLSGNRLIYVAKNKEELVLERELKHMLGNNCTIMLTRENRAGYEYQKINEDFLKERISNFNQQFYVSGPEIFVNEVKEVLNKLQATNITFEIFDQ